MSREVLGVPGASGARGYHVHNMPNEDAHSSINGSPPPPPPKPVPSDERPPSQPESSYDVDAMLTSHQPTLPQSPGPNSDTHPLPKLGPQPPAVFGSEEVLSTLSKGEFKRYISSSSTMNSAQGEFRGTIRTFLHLPFLSLPTLHTIEDREYTDLIIFLGLKIRDLDEFMNVPATPATTAVICVTEALTSTRN